MEVEEIRVIPKGIVVWSVSLQENISFEKDLPVKITNTVYNNDNYFYGVLQLELFKHRFPSLVDKVNGDVGLSYKETKKYE